MDFRNDVNVGMILRSQRLKKKLEIKQVCSGVCSEGYLCKVELRKARVSESIARRLFSVLGIQIASAETAELLEKFYFRYTYVLDYSEVFATLKKRSHELENSDLLVDWLLACSLVSGKPDRRTEALADIMSDRQKGFYHYILGTSSGNTQAYLEEMEKAHALLQNAFSICWLFIALFQNSSFSRIFGLQEEAEKLCLRDGNIPALIEITAIIGSCYSNFNLDKMYELYQRSLNLIESSAHTEKPDGIYYNIGASFLQEGQYQLAGKNLDLCREDFPLLNQKKALLHIRKGEIDAALPYLEEFGNDCRKSGDKLNVLLYEEARMEMIPDFEKKPESLKLVKDLQKELSQTHHLGYLIFFRKVFEKVYCAHRQYKDAYALQKLISSGLGSGMAVKLKN